MSNLKELVDQLVITETCEGEWLINVGKYNDPTDVLIPAEVAQHLLAIRHSALDQGCCDSNDLRSNNNRLCALGGVAMIPPSDSDPSPSRGLRDLRAAYITPKHDVSFGFGFDPAAPNGDFTALSIRYKGETFLFTGSEAEAISALITQSKQKAATETQTLIQAAIEKLKP